MKNRSFILGLTMLALFASACTKGDWQKDAISFAPVASKPTKAIISGTTYPTGESFKVSAFHNGTAAYFEGLTASRISDNLWETSGTQYWPLGGSLLFHAYSPASASATIGASGVSVSGYTIQNTTQMETDFCYASATVANCDSHPNAVPLAFSHALSQVVFRVKAASYYANTTLTLNSLSIAGIYSVGDFTGSAWENQDTEYTYNLSSTPTDLTYDGNTPVVTEVCSFLFIPQEFGANAALRVGYGIKQTISGTDYTLTNQPVSIPLFGSSLAAWEMGKKYIYTINIGMDNVITFTASTVGWQDENDNIIVEEN